MEPATLTNSTDLKIGELLKEVQLDYSPAFTKAVDDTVSAIESGLTLACIDKCRDGGFEEIFMTTVDYPVKYDHIIRLNLKGNSAVYTSGFCFDDECWRLYEQKVQSVLIQGLSDRVKTVRVTWRNILSDHIIKNVRIVNPELEFPRALWRKLLGLLILVQMLIIKRRLFNSASSGGKSRSSGDLKMVKLQKAQFGKVSNGEDILS
ncbi:hypothetical protein EV2_018982 [Malus domestica]